MSFKPREYYHGQLPDSKGTLVTAGVNNVINVRSIEVHNSNASSSNTITFYYNNGSNDLQFFKRVLDPNETYLLEYSRSSKVLSPADIIAGSATTASEVTCTITGEEETGV